MGPALAPNRPTLEADETTPPDAAAVNRCGQSGATEWLAVTGLGVTATCASVLAADMLDTRTELAATLVRARPAEASVARVLRSWEEGTVVVAAAEPVLVVVVVVVVGATPAAAKPCCCCCCVTVDEGNTDGDDNDVDGRRGVEEEDDDDDDDNDSEHEEE